MLKYLLEGGPLMWALLSLSILSLGVIIDRWKVFKMAEVDTTGMRKKLRQLLSTGELDGAMDACRETRGPVAATLLVGLDRYARLIRIGRQKSDIEASVASTMEDYAPHAINAVEKRVNLLLLVGSTSPLIGMTGTVTGMISAFQGMAAAGGALQGDIVAEGIGEALITTAAGLLIAVPAVIFYNIFSNKVDQLTLSLEESATELVDFIHLS